MKRSNFLVKSIFAGLLAVSPLLSITSFSQAQTVQVRGVEHVGINVPDMDEAIRFFSSTFGFTPVTEMRDLPVNAEFKKRYHMHDSAQVKRLVMLRAGNGANIELFQYDSPEATKEQRYYDDAGESHIGFYTDDINAAVATLRAKGVNVLNDPIVMTQGPTAGETWTYFLTPWGSKLELVSYPKGKAYEKQSGSTRIWTPQPFSPEDSDSITPEQVQTLATHYLPVLNETDASKRMTGVQAYYARDTYFADPEGVFTGQTALNNFFTELQQKNPGWKFKQIGKAAVAGKVARVAWQFGPDSNPVQVLGEDILFLHGGKIAATFVYLTSVK